MTTFPKRQPKRKRSPSGFSQATKALILQRDGGLCVVCGPHCTGQASPHPHHRVERGMGGNRGMDCPQIGVAACSICNGEIETNLGDWARERGLLIRRSQSTARDIQRALEVPVRYPDGRLYLLTNDGRKVAING